MQKHSQPHPILLIEDDPLTRSLIAKFLEREGFTITQTLTAEDALQLLCPHCLAPAHPHNTPSPSPEPPFSAIILDLELPGMNGLEFLRKIRRHYHHALLPIIILTCESDITITSQCFEVGASDYVVKPVPLHVLRARLNTHLAIRNAHLRLLRDTTTPTPHTHKTHQPQPDPLRLLRTARLLATRPGLPHSARSLAHQLTRQARLLTQKPR